MRWVARRYRHAWRSLGGRPDAVARFVLADISRALRFNERIVFRREGLRLRLYDSSITRQLWLDPQERPGDRNDYRLLEAWLRPGDIAIDVGANIGMMTLVAARRVGPEGLVLACEPHPRIYRYLDGNVRLNAAGNVRARNVALGEAAGEARMEDRKFDDMNSLSGGSLHVPLTTLDKLMEREGLQGRPIGLLKIDVEGYELMVLRGAKTTLGRVDCVYFEVKNEHCARFGHRPSDVAEELRAAGFTLWVETAERRLGPLPQGFSPERVQNVIAVRDVEKFADRCAYSIGAGLPRTS